MLFLGVRLPSSRLPSSFFTFYTEWVTIPIPTTATRVAPDLSFLFSVVGPPF